MNVLRRLFNRIKDGALRDMLRELAWICRWGVRYLRHVLFYTFLGLLGVGMGLAAGVLSKYIIDTVLRVDSIALVPAGIAYVSMQLFRIVLNAWAGRISARIRVDVEHEIRREVYEKVMNTRWEHISAFHSGDILSRVENDVTTAAASVLGWLPDLVTRTAQFVGILCVILYYDPTLALLALISAPVTLLVSYSLSRRMRDHAGAMRQASSNVTAFTEESFQNLQVIKSFGLTEGYVQRLGLVQEKLRKEKLDYNRFHVNTSALMNLVGTVVAVTCFSWSVYRLWGGYITYGTMTLFLQLSGSLTGAFSALVGMIPAMIGGATAAGRIMAITQLPSENREDDARVTEFYEKNRHSGIAVVARDITCAYSDSPVVLHSVSFQAEPGQIVGLVGPSGEGKTTLLRLILGIVSPLEGRLAVCGGEQELPVSASTRQLFAYVPQRSAFFSGTLAENLRLLRQDATDEELWEALRLACAEKFVRKLPLGLNSPVQEAGGGFSQGQIQRLMLARALVADVPVLLLDEATSALDPKTEQAVLRGLAEGKQKRTCIVTTHHTSVLPMCDVVYRVSGGKVEKLNGDQVREIMEKEMTKEDSHG